LDYSRKQNTPLPPARWVSENSPSCREGQRLWKSRREGREG